jgi:hypothetical protein
LNFFSNRALIIQVYIVKISIFVFLNLFNQFFWSLFERSNLLLLLLFFQFLPTIYLYIYFYYLFIILLLFFYFFMGTQKWLQQIVLSFIKWNSLKPRSCFLSLGRGQTITFFFIFILKKTSSLMFQADRLKNKQKWSFKWKLKTQKRKRPKIKNSETRGIRMQKMCLMNSKKMGNKA